MTPSNHAAWLETSSGDLVIHYKGKLTNVPPDHPKRATIRALLRKGLYQEATETADLHKVFAKEFIQYTVPGIKITQSESGKILLNDEYIEHEVGLQALHMLDKGMPVAPLLKFLVKMRQNEDPRVRQQLLSFMTKNDFFIDYNGDIVCWKKVGKDAGGNLVDLWTKKLIYNPPRTVTMPRGAVMNDPTNACGPGLHFATWRFTYNYSGNAVVEMRVDPRDVVSIPYSETDKGRAQTTRIVKEIKNWLTYGRDNPPIPGDAISPATWGSDWQARMDDSDEGLDDWEEDYEACPNCGY